jgi:hypothetical protein
MSAKTAAIVIGLLFVAVGLLGYVDNPVIGESEAAIFHANSVHNLVHIISGILFLIVAYASPANVPMFCKVFGTVYLLLGILGLFRIGSDGMTTLLGFLHVNGADNYLHIVLGLAILLVGFVARRSGTVSRT